MTAPEYRACPLTGRAVLLAPGRAGRPRGFAAAFTESPAADCPFCEGREADTPAESYAIRGAGSRPNAPGWRVRVVPNKYPAVPPGGVHEVVVECPDHRRGDLTAAELADVFASYRGRMRFLLALPGVELVTVFRNVGAEAGASLAHPHSQVVATPFTPPAVVEEQRHAERFFERVGRCGFCVAATERVIAETPTFAAVAPFAPRFAYETWLLPKPHRSRFESISDAECAELADLATRVLAALTRLGVGAAYNWSVRSAPPGGVHHWRLELTPRTARFAGFEWSTGCVINTVRPEDAAARMREALHA